MFKKEAAKLCCISDPSPLISVRAYVTFNHFAEPELPRNEKVLNSQAVRLPSAAKHLVNSHMIPSERTPSRNSWARVGHSRCSFSVKEFFLESGQWASLLGPPLVQHYFSGCSFLHTAEDISGQLNVAMHHAGSWIDGP